MIRSGLPPAAIRGTIALVAVIDLVSFYFFIGEARIRALAGGAPIDGMAVALSREPVRALVIALGIVGALAFAHGAGRLVAGLSALVALVVLSAVHAQLFGSPFRHLYYSGLCLLGWLTGLMASRLGGRPSDESYARIGSIAVLGAAYLNAGISKLAFGGFEWAGGAPIQAVVVAQDGLVRDGIVSAYRSWVVMSPAVVGLFSFATMVFELAGPLMMLGGKARVMTALGLLSMHLNIYVLTAILYWESMVFLVVLGVLPHEEAPQSQAPAIPALASRRRFVASVVVLCVASLFAIGHQRRRYQAWVVGQVAPQSPPVRVAEPAPTQRIGPFSVGDQVTDDWSIESLGRTDGGFTVTLRGPAGRTRFEIDCTDRERRSPFDVGSAHIFYSVDVPFPIVEPVGNALRARVQGAAAPRDPCEAVKEWTQSIR